MTSRDLAGCPLVAALAEAHRAIRKHVTRTERIAFSPTNPPRRRGLPQAIQRKDANRLDFIPPRADRKTASSMECFQVHVIKAGGFTHASTFPRFIRRPGLPNESPSKRGEGAGNAGREPHPQPRVQNERAHEHSHHRFSRNIPAFPAQWFYGFLRALPGDLALLPPSSARCKASSANLTPALACQDHTTSPSASASLVWRHQYVHRIPRPTLVTIAKRPFSGRGTRRNATDLG